MSTQRDEKKGGSGGRRGWLDNIKLEMKRNVRNSERTGGGGGRRKKKLRTQEEIYEERRVNKMK